MDASISILPPVTSLATAMLFGTILFGTVAITVESYLTGDWRLIQVATSSTRATALDWRSPISLYTLLYQTSILGLLLWYAYLCEHHPPYPHAEKTYDRDEFFFLTALLMVVAAFTFKRNDAGHPKQTGSSSVDAHFNGTSLPRQQQQQQQQQNNESEPKRSPVAPVNEANEVLNRDQTEEWKGWMQFMFLLYHYYRAEEVYNAIRIMITCYVWMTGFGNFSFFYLKDDYSAVRVLQMLWRLNFLVVLLCLTQGTTYILYYICLLHTYFFLMVYVTMRVAKHVNYSFWGLRLKLAVLALVIFCMWDVNTGLFQVIHSPFLGHTPIVGATSGTAWEWYFRSSLDHWSTFLGMVFALNFPVTSLWVRKVEAQPLIRHVCAKLAVGIVLVGAAVVWVTGPFQLNKFDYNQTNAYFGVIPLLAYIYLRNITPWLRSHTMDLLHQIGKTTLETYLMQHHIWLTSNAKSLLTLIPGWPKMNFLLVTILYVYVSRRLYQITLFLRGMILPDNRNACIRNLLHLAVAFSFFLGLTFLMKLANLLSLASVGVCSVILGCILYQWFSLKGWTTITLGSEVVHEKGSGIKSKSRASAVVIGIMTLLCVGSLWKHLASTGAGPIQPLPSTCSESVNRGRWVPVDGCNENSRGLSYRDYGIGSMGTCSASIWGWEASQCRFVHRDKASLRKSLGHRHVVFVGDSIVRHLYYALCRQLGESNAGSYNTSIEKWADISRQYGSVKLDFKWAPYISNLTKNVDNFLSPLDGAASLDLIVLGGGAWDRLQTYNTEAERVVMHDNVEALARRLENLKATTPVSWVEPTTMNSWALMTEQKRANMKEEHMVKFRAMYRKLGLPDAATFVLNGTAFTFDRVDESYDGVHYPLSVYDGGIQILANALDWLLLKRSAIEERKRQLESASPTVGSMDNPVLGLIMLGFCLVGLLFLDGYMGASFVATLFVPTVSPRSLYDEAFASLHQRMGLTPGSSSGTNASGIVSVALRPLGVQYQQDKSYEKRSDSEEETDGLMANAAASLGSSDKI